jgi:hypothetical protein
MRLYSTYGLRGDDAKHLLCKDNKNIEHRDNTVITLRKDLPESNSITTYVVISSVH